MFFIKSFRYSGALFLGLFLITATLLLTGEKTVSAQNESQLHDLRSQDEITSGTKLLKAKEGVVEEGVVTFEMMKETTLKSTPPPIFTPEVDALDGKEVTIRGFMTPYDSLTQFKKFMIFPNATGCQFCAVPSPKEVVFVRLKSDDDQEFISAPIEVKGTLSIWKEDKVDKDEAHKSFLFVVNDATVKAIKG